MVSNIINIGSPTKRFLAVDRESGHTIGIFYKLEDAYAYFHEHNNAKIISQVLQNNGKWVFSGQLAFERTPFQSVNKEGE